MTGFRLIETMRVSERGDVLLLERHLERLRLSAEFFSFKFDSVKLRAGMPRTPGRFRVMLSPDGTLDVTVGPLPAGNPSCLKLSRVRVDSSDPFLYHKTTNRKIYDEARQDCSEESDVVLVNERGEITETTIANIAVLRVGRWITPPVSCGLLPGVMRAELLSRGELAEGVILANELVGGETVRCFNALRSVFGATYSPPL
jgi:para-aminobenzoate synthetase/4-amino-4-deoxychorismate lyase